MANTYSAGIATAYGAAVRGGYTGTYDEWCALMADYATVGEQAAQAAQAAQASAENAAESETAAAASEAAAAASATGAAASASAASASEAAAQTAEANAAASATDAAGSATAAATSATNAAASEAAARAVEESIPEDYSELSADVGDLKSQMGNLADLDTTDKSSLVAAINEAAQSGGGGGGDITDVQVNGVSVVQDGVANVPVAGNSVFGVTKVNINQGIGVDSASRNLYIAQASEGQAKAGTNVYKPITPANQHQSAFYGLAKAAGDTTQSASSNAVGAYTDEAKAAIQSMLDVPANGDLNDVETATLGTIDSSTDEWMIRKNNRGLVKKVDLPSSFGPALNIDIFGDGYTFQTSYDVSINKNDSSSLPTPIVYCSPTGGGNGTTEETPTTLDGALNTAYNRDNQTLLLLDGVHCCGYGREIKAKINIIAKNKGKAFICGGHATRPSYTAESDNTYKTSVYNVVKAMQLIDNELYSLSSAESLDACKATSGTAYFTSSEVYVHLYNNAVPSADNVLLTRSVANRPTLNIKNTFQNTNVYLEGVVVVGGCPSALYVSNSSSYTSAKISAKDCVFLNSYDTNNGKVCEIRGADAYFQNCVAKFGSFDGFGYTQANGIGCSFIEINCTGAFNGLDGNASGSQYQNGSTAHQNCKGIRLNGRYFNNYGGNVADVQTGCETLNLACVAFDSESDMDGASTDFSTQQAGAIMNLIGCRAFGKSKYNIYAYSDTTMNLTHCRYNNTQGSGTINVLAE